MKNLTASDEMFQGVHGAFARIISAVGQAMGAYSATMSGTPNFAHEIAQAALREVAEKQRRDAEQAQAAGRNARNAYTDALQRYGNPEMAQQALFDRGEAIYRKMLENNALKHGTPEMVARIKAENADAETQRRMRWAERNGKAAGAVSESFRYVPPSGGGATLDKDMLKLGLDAAKLFGGSPEEQKDQLARLVRLPEGQRAYAASPEARKQAQETLVTNEDIRTEAGRIHHLMEQPGAQTDPAKRGQLHSALRNLQLTLKDSAKLGTWDNGSAAILDDITGDPASLTNLGGVQAKLREVQSTAAKRIQNVKRYELYVDPQGRAPLVGQQPRGVQSDE